jgi:hypothetical protein
MLTEYEMYTKEPESMSVDELEAAIDLLREALKNQATSLLLVCTKEACEYVARGTLKAGDVIFNQIPDSVTVKELNSTVKILREARHRLALRYQYNPYEKE